MKAKYLLLIFAIFIGALINAQTKFASARIFEMQMKKYSRIIVTYEDGTSKNISLESLKIIGSPEKLNGIMSNNQRIINDFLEEMTKKGYEIVSINSSGTNLLYTQIFFSREPNIEKKENTKLEDE